MANYSNGKVYKIEPICDHEEGDIYIGSTTKKYLSQRMEEHRRRYRSWKIQKYRKVTVFELFDKFGLENCHIVLLETVNAKIKDELLAREKHYMKTLACVNKHNPLRTNEEKKVQRNETVKKFYLNNPEKLIEHREKAKLKSQQIFKCLCGSSYKWCQNSSHLKTKKHIEYIKENEIKESNDPIDI